MKCLKLDITSVFLLPSILRKMGGGVQRERERDREWRVILCSVLQYIGWRVPIYTTAFVAPYA